MSAARNCATCEHTALSDDADPCHACLYGSKGGSWDRWTPPAAQVQALARMSLMDRRAALEGIARRQGQAVADALKRGVFELGGDSIKRAGEMLRAAKEA